MLVSNCNINYIFSRFIGLGNRLSMMNSLVVNSLVVNSLVMNRVVNSLMVGSMVTGMETSMVDGCNTRMGRGVTSMGSMSNSVNSEAIFVDGLMAMLGWGMVKRPMVNSPMVKGLVMGMGVGMSGNMVCSGESKKQCCDKAGGLFHLD